MPINIPSNLPAFKTLKDESIFVMSAERALTQDIRALKIAIVNLMPTKIETETQLLRLLSNTPLQADITLIKTSTYVPKHASYEHMATFYKTFGDVKGEKFDALVITGAPVEKMDFLDVVYWEELCEMLEWSKSHAFSVMHICWGAQAGLYYHYGINKRELPRKLSGIYPQRPAVNNHPLLKGFDEVFYVPQSRYTEIKPEDIEKSGSLTVLAGSPVSGAHIIADKTNRQIFITGHGEYDRETLKNEYLRDKERGLNPEIPYNYFPDDDPEKEPIYTWRGHASLMYSNWLNFCVYQETPFDLNNLKELEIDRNASRLSSM
ncbi:MAG: homoserine O-succinyltransferase [Oscillospiraceae bacterium]|jgi:homoserine O-succinyltransferase|nr:homoserine O-succinyltransferase [Oscillospiraceae bacterium]